ncbi:MAG: hypothetical protein HND48_13120 [Chloroflexi bacterium]|nr:hypothetical protein [Chloroflexota bacterium]
MARDIRRHLAFDVQRLVLFEAQRCAQRDAGAELLFEKLGYTRRSSLAPCVALRIFLDQALHNLHLLRVMMIDGVELILIDFPSAKSPARVSIFCRMWSNVCRGSSGVFRLFCCAIGCG